MKKLLPAPEPQPAIRRSQLWLGTFVEIAAVGSPQRRLDAGVAAAFATIARVHVALSGHDPASELSRVNRLAGGALQPISADMRSVLTCALDVAARSAAASIRRWAAMSRRWAFCHAMSMPSAT
jgi:thiamine biosynthesis lipoprotein